MAIISGSPIRAMLESYDKATADLTKARADMMAAMEAYGEAAARQVFYLSLLGAPDHETARQWVRDYKRAGVLPEMQGPHTLEESRIGYCVPSGDAYRLATRMMGRYGDTCTHRYIGSMLYQLGEMKGKQLERARRKKHK